MIISVSGTPGSGKSTLAKMLAKKIGYKRYYMGALFRAVAKKKNMKLRELLELGEKQSWVDGEIDAYQKKLGKTEDNFIIEGRTSFLMIPNSIKIFITVDERVGAARVFEHLKVAAAERNEDHNLHSIDDVLASHKRRMKTDTKRYFQYYNTAVFDPKNYDLVLDTSHDTIDQAFQKLYSFVIDKTKAEKTG